MGGPGEAVFINTAARHEHPADDIGPLARCSADELIVAQASKPAQIGIEGTDLFLAFEQVYAISFGIQRYLPRLRSQQAHCFGPFAGTGFDQGQAEFIARIAARHLQHARFAGAKRDSFAAVACQQHMAARQRGVTAQADLHGGREPAQFPVRFPRLVLHEEGGLGEIVLFRDRQQGRVVEPLVERHYRRLIAGERAVGKGIDMPIGQADHGRFSSFSNSLASTSVLPGASIWPRGSI